MTGGVDAPKMRALLTEIELDLRQTARTEDVIVQNFSHLDIDHILPEAWGVQNKTGFTSC